MKVVVSTLGKFWSFDLARQLHARGLLAAIFTGYPRFKLRGERLPPALIRSFPLVHTPYMGFPGRQRLGTRINRLWEFIDRVAIDGYARRRLPACDVFVGLSGSSLRTGIEAQRRGARYVCDRGSTHIRVQDRLMREEAELWGQPYAGIDPRIIGREEGEYAASDCITVPSTFNVESFVEQGVPREKLRLLPFGVDLSRFHPVGGPDPARFDLLFVGGMGFRKGVPYLLQAYRQLQHPAKSLTLAGVPDPAFIAVMKQRGLWPEDVRILGHVPQDRLKDVMSAAHALVLPSIEEGLALVQAQALACGCPVVASSHTGAADLFEDGTAGFIVPIRQTDVLLQRLQALADDPDLRARMSQAAVARVRAIGGWDTYGDRAVSIYRELTR